MSSLVGSKYEGRLTGQTANGAVCERAVDQLRAKLLKRESINTGKVVNIGVRKESV